MKSNHYIYNSYIIIYIIDYYIIMYKKLFKKVIDYIHLDNIYR